MVQWNPEKEIEIQGVDSVGADEPGAPTDIWPGGARFSTRAKRAEIFFVHPL